jgi:Recombinase
VPVEEEQSTIKLMRRWRNSGLSFARIASRLTERGIEPKDGNTWHATTVKRILERTG